MPTPPPRPVCRPIRTRFRHAGCASTAPNSSRRRRADGRPWWRRSAAGAARSARWSSKANPRDLDERQFVDAIHDFGRQLSFALENVQLLEEVMQQRRLLEDTFNSLIDLVVVTDSSTARRPNERRVRQQGRAVRAVAVIDRPLPNWSARKSRSGSRPRNRPRDRANDTEVTPPPPAHPPNHRRTSRRASSPRR